MFSYYIAKKNKNKVIYSRDLRVMSERTVQVVKVVE